MMAVGLKGYVYTLPAKIFDRTLNSQGTVQYFRSVHTGLINQVEF